MQGFFQVAGRLDGLALGIDRHLHLVLHGGLDTPLFERRLVVLGEHEGGLLAGLPCDVALVGFSFLVHQAGDLDRSPGFEFEAGLLGKLLLAEGLRHLLIGDLFQVRLVRIHRQPAPVAEEKFELHLGCAELHGSRINLGLLPLLGSGKELADHRLALFEPGYLVRGKGMPVLLRRDIDLGEREGDQLVGLEVAADKGFDLLARPVGDSRRMSHVARLPEHLLVGVGDVVAEELLLHLLRVEDAVAAHGQPAVRAGLERELAVVAVRDAVEVEMHPDGLVGLEAPEHLVEHPVAFDLLPLHAEGGEAVPVDVLRAVLVLRVLFGLPGGLLRRTLRLLLLPGLGLLLRLHGRLHLVLRNERLARLDGLALPLPEIGGYPLHLLFRHTEEVEAGRIFQLVPEVGKEI